MYSLFGYIHARFAALRSQTGQGTVEYVALILLVAGVMAAVVSFAEKGDNKSLAEKITGQVTAAIDKAVGGTKK